MWERKLASKSRIQKSVEKKLSDLLRGDNKPERGELQLLSVAVKYLSVIMKMDENEWGHDLESLDVEDELDAEIKHTEGS